MLLLEIEEVFCNLDEQDFEEAFRIVSDRSDEEGWEYLKIPCRRVHIALGEYVEISPEQIAIVVEMLDLGIFNTRVKDTNGRELEENESFCILDIDAIQEILFNQHRYENTRLRLLGKFKI